MTYLVSGQEPWDEYGYGTPEYDASILEVQADYGRRGVNRRRSGTSPATDHEWRRHAR
jgi:hypothetical protein